MMNKVGIYSRLNIVGLLPSIARLEIPERGSCNLVGTGRECCYFLASTSHFWSDCLVDLGHDLSN